MPLLFDRPPPLKKLLPGRTVAIVIATALTTLALVLLAVNLTGGEQRIDSRVERMYALEDARFAYELGALMGPPFVGGNAVTTLVNGDRIFPAMLDAIRGAKSSITFESYIYWSGEIGDQFADALIERVQHGVEVHVLLDWVGSAKMDLALIDKMKAAGVELERYHKPHWAELGRLNNRTHRKLLIIDGQVGFTGGVGIAPSWTGNAQDPDHWRDTHFRVDGPIVAQMQAVFMDNWVKVTGAVLHGQKYFPDLPPKGQVQMQMFSSSPTGGSDSMQLMYLLSITAASRSIDLSAAYFVPDDLTLGALKGALARGVRIRIIVPGEHIDSDAVRSASRAKWGPLLQGGAVIAEYGPTMFHCKELIVDNLLVSVGSTNFDNRSFRLNDEATLNILDARFAQTQTAMFEADLAKSKVVTYAQWAERPWRERAAERLSSLIGSQL
ncbi:phospholipase D-like domain-containing protein [soil metagenome]